MNNDILLVSKAMAKIKGCELPTNFNGHYEFESRFYMSSLKMSLFDLNDEQLRLIIEGQKLSEPILLQLGLTKCPYCAERISFSFDGENLSVSTVCPYPGGMENVSVELNIPSGKMVFANDLRRWFRIIGDFDVNNDIGVKLTTEAYEKVGMAHGFVGNSCPSVYKVDGRTLTISGTPSDEYYDEETDEELPALKELYDSQLPAGEAVGGICTDLWWYSVVDFDDFRARFLDMAGSEESFDAYIKDRCDVINVDPGVYQVVHNMRRRDYDSKEPPPHHYAKFTWLREPEVRRYLEGYKSQDRTIGQAWLASLALYPDLYGFTEEELPESLSMEERVIKMATFPRERLESSLQRFYSHTFCTIGAGVDWHPNGWGSSQEVPASIPDIAVPEMMSQGWWYPMSREYSALCLAAFNTEKWGERVHLNDSFLAAAYDVIYSILKFGVKPRSDPRIDRAEETKKIALECLHGLNKRYPRTIPECCQGFLK